MLATVEQEPLDFFISARSEWYKQVKNEILGLYQLCAEYEELDEFFETFQFRIEQMYLETTIEIQATTQESISPYFTVEDSVEAMDDEEYLGEILSNSFDMISYNRSFSAKDPFQFSAIDPNFLMDVAKFIKSQKLFLPPGENVPWSYLGHALYAEPEYGCAQDAPLRRVW